MALPAILPFAIKGTAAAVGLSTLLDMFKKDKKTSVSNDNASKVSVPIYNVSNNLSRPNNATEASKLANRYGGGGSSSGGGVANRIDMTPYINALKEGAAANKKTISDTYSADRNLLAQQLKQYQENTATARRQAMDAYNSARADLEEQSYMNMRAAQQSAASRGLGGSGLQQLAQLSSQIESSNQTSNLSEQNTETQNELTKQLKDQESNINSQISNLINEERNKITEIDANVAQAIAQAQYQEEVRYQQALAEAAARNAAIAAQNSSVQGELENALDSFSGNLDALLTQGINDMVNTFNSSDYVKNQKYNKKNANTLNDALAKSYNNALSNLTAYYGESGIGTSGRSYYDYYAQQLRNAYSMLSNNKVRN